MKGNVKKAASWAEEMAAKDALKLAQQLSSGTKTESDRRKADFPFAVRHLQPKWVPWLIHKHTGEFYRGWQIQKGLRQGEGIFVVNYSEHAAELKHGTGVAFARPIDEKIITMMESKTNNYFRIALEGK